MTVSYGGGGGGGVALLADRKTKSVPIVVPIDCLAVKVRPVAREGEEIAVRTI